MAKAGSKKYPLKFKVDALMLLQQNSFNAKITAEQLNMSQRTLAEWKKKFGPDVYGTLEEDDKLLVPDERFKKIGELRKSVLNREEMFLEKVYDARDEALKRGLELLPKTQDLKKVADFIRIAHEIITGDHIKSLEERKQSTTFFNFIQNQFIKNENNTTQEY